MENKPRDRITAKREKMCKTINDFLDRNKDYAIEIYLKDAGTEFIIGRFFAPSERNYDCYGEKGCRISWNGRNNDITIPYDVISCYEETDFDGQAVYVILKNDIMVVLECCGMKM